MLYLLLPFSFTFPTILLFAIAKYDVAMRIRPMRSSLSWQKVIKCHEVFLRSENSSRQVNHSRILLYITTGNWVGLERNDRRCGNRETCANADAYFTAILNFADPSHTHSPYKSLPLKGKETSRATPSPTYLMLKNLAVIFDYNFAF